IKRLSEEFRYYIDTYGISQFEIADNAFSSSPSFYKALENLSNDGIEINWGGNCNIYELNKQKLIKYKNLGLKHCYFGIESSSPKIRRLMGKNINISHEIELLKLSYQNQIKSSLYFMIGFPGETTEDFQKTLDFIKENNIYIYDITTSVFTLMVGTPVFNLNLLTPIQLGPKTLNAFTYQTKDGVTHEERKNRFLSIQILWNQIKELKT
ncbi:MAG: B12-binding domain-containing radical SAM protein, partial [Promethearchaeota archaeon]